MKPLWQGRNKQKRYLLTRGHNWPFRCLDCLSFNTGCQRRLFAKGRLFTAHWSWQTTDRVIGNNFTKCKSRRDFGFHAMIGAGSDIDLAEKENKRNTIFKEQKGSEENEQWWCQKFLLLLCRRNFFHFPAHKNHNSRLWKKRLRRKTL